MISNFIGHKYKIQNSLKQINYVLDDKGKNGIILKKF
jgi:hypothetical protein